MLVNGENVTDQLKDGMLTLPEVYEDQQIVVETEESTEDDKKMIKKTIPPEAVSRKIKNLRNTKTCR